MHLHGVVYDLFANPILFHLGVLASWREFMFSQSNAKVRDAAEPYSLQRLVRLEFLSHAKTQRRQGSPPEGR
jgi:hypothetical protein